MARICEVCSKATTFGRTVSHAHNVSSRVFKPNLQQVRVREENGRVHRVRVCTRCLRDGRVRKAVS